MTQTEQLGAFVTRISYEDIPEPDRRQLRIRVLDAAGCALGAIRLTGKHVDALSRLDSIQVAEFTRLLAETGELGAKHA